MRRPLRHASTAAAGAEPAALTGEGDQSIQSAGCAPTTGEPAGQASAPQEVTKLLLDKSREPIAVDGAPLVIGHSLGGRLALMSSADVMVAMSPSVMVQMSPQGKWMFENLPSPSVREPYPTYVLELLEKLGPVPSHGRPCLLLYSERDIQTLLDGATVLQAQLPLAEKRLVSENIRPDVQHEHGLIRYLPRWFNHGELRFNSSARETASAWLADHLARA